MCVRACVGVCVCVCVCACVYARMYVKSMYFNYPSQGNSANNQDLLI